MVKLKDLWFSAVVWCLCSFILVPFDLKELSSAISMSISLLCFIGVTHYVYRARP